MRGLHNTSTHDQKLELNLKAFVLKPNALSTGPHSCFLSPLYVYFFACVLITMPSLCYVCNPGSIISLHQV